MPEYYIREAHNGEAALSLEAYTKNLYGLGKSSHARTCVEARKRDPDIVTLLGLEKAGIAHNTLSLPEFARDAVSIIASEESASPNTRNITWIHTRIKKRGFASKAMDKFKESFPVGYTLRTEPGMSISPELTLHHISIL